MVAKPAIETPKVSTEAMWVDGEPENSPLVLDFRPVLDLMAQLEYTERDIDRWLIEFNHANHELVGWLIDPYQQQVHIYRPGVAPHVLDNPETISADPELPGFVFEVRRRIFDRENEPR